MKPEPVEIKMQQKFQLPLMGLALALGMIGSSYIIGGVVKDVRMSHQIIKVRGYAEKTVESDLAVWRVSWAVRTTALSDGYAMLDSQTAKIMAFLQENGSPKNIVKKFPLELSEERRLDENGNPTNQIEYLVMTQYIEITSPDVKGIEKLSNQIDRLVQEGIAVRSYQPQFYFSGLNDLKSELLTLATQDARLRAQTLAEGSGVELGVLRAARQGDFSVKSGAEATIADEGGYDDTSSIVKKVTAVVTVDYSMK